MDRARIRVDFNELVEPDLVLLSKDDVRTDSEGSENFLESGKQIYVYEVGLDSSGRQDNVIADGRVEENTFGHRTSAAKRSCRIDSKGIRHESDDERE